MSAEPRITRAGKQVLLDGAHLADAVSDEAADVIAIALKAASLCDDFTHGDILKIEAFFA